MFEELRKDIRYYFPKITRVIKREIGDDKGLPVESNITLHLYIYWSFRNNCWKSGWVMVSPTDLTKGDSWLPYKTRNG